MLNVNPSDVRAESDLEVAVNQLKNILTPPTIEGERARIAKQARFAAGGAVNAASEKLRVAVKATGYDPRYAPAQAVVAASRQLEDAEREKVQAQVNQGRARELDDDEYRQELMKKIDAAAPTLRRLLILWNEAIDPLVMLNVHRHQHNRPGCRLLDLVPHLAQVTQQMAALLNVPQRQG